MAYSANTPRRWGHILPRCSFGEMNQTGTITIIEPVPLDTSERTPVAGAHEVSHSIGSRPMGLSPHVTRAEAHYPKSTRVGYAIEIDSSLKGTLRIVEATSSIYDNNSKRGMYIEGQVPVTGKQTESASSSRVLCFFLASCNQSKT